MLHRRPAILQFSLCALLFPVLTLGALAQEFSADFVNTAKGKEDASPSKIYVGKDKMRIESRERGQMGMGAAIMDFANQKMIILMPQQKMYMESTPQTLLKKQDIWLRPDDPNNACPQYESLVKKHNPNKTVTCRKVGEDIINGRPAIKYAGTSDNGSGYMWIDRQLRFVVKWQDDKGNTGELRNIQEGHQAASLFEVPPDFHKFDMQMMQRPQQ